VACIFDVLAAGDAARHIRLIRDHHQQEAGGFQSRQGRGRIRVDLHFGGSDRRVGLAIADQRARQHAVAIQEHGALHRSDSQRVSAAFSAGCETSRCQTTAWKASACGVMCAGFTAGTITQASATCAV
jgi:hypothetical protein